METDWFDAALLLESLYADLEKMEDVRCLSYDRWTADYITAEVMEKFPDIRYENFMKSEKTDEDTTIGMADKYHLSMGEIERKLKKRQIVFQKNKAFAWMLGNVDVRTRHQGEKNIRRPNKRGNMASNKIDGAVSWIMANYYIARAEEEADDFILVTPGMEPLVL